MRPRPLRRRSGGGTIGVSRFGANLAAGSDVELRSTYTLAPKEKAAVSKVIDGLIQRLAVTVFPDETHALGKDLVVELNGQTRITAASLVGKMFYVMRMLLDSTEGDIEAVLDMSAEDDEASQALKRVYLRNEPLPVPTAALTAPGARPTAWAGTRWWATPPPAGSLPSR
ncbi:hypothetical protein KIK06_24050 [Nocardiopsis sp. EMB25]|uniref:hypothetical protein n=1 Tax=Nocardiopsis sp. EMB25 TaxID=2835867 RepID=UPI0022844E79|nr:hypothetical protein [Nocardiopsis sp. EMB25]MCY9786961.1 hypothetical protein [Nocardiopsis sp. EMB25]